ncbi:MAG: hypothetical protein WCP20_09755 [Desulfuromonadales bacterium]
MRPHAVTHIEQQRARSEGKVEDALQLFLLAGGLIQADAKFMDERDDIAEYIGTLEAGKALDEKAIRTGFESFKASSPSCRSPAMK